MHADDKLEQREDGPGGPGGWTSHSILVIRQYLESGHLHHAALELLVSYCLAPNILSCFFSPVVTSFVKN